MMINCCIFRYRSSLSGHWIVVAKGGPRISAAVADNANEASKASNSKARGFVLAAPRSLAGRTKSSYVGTLGAGGSAGSSGARHGVQSLRPRQPLTSLSNSSTPKTPKPTPKPAVSR